MLSPQDNSKKLLPQDKSITWSENYYYRVPVPRMWVPRMVDRRCPWSPFHSSYGYHRDDAYHDITPMSPVERLPTRRYVHSHKRRFHKNKTKHDRFHQPWQYLLRYSVRKGYSCARIGSCRACFWFYSYQSYAIWWYTLPTTLRLFVLILKHQSYAFR